MKRCMRLSESDRAATWAWKQRQGPRQPRMSWRLLTRIGKATNREVLTMASSAAWSHGRPDIFANISRRAKTLSFSQPRAAAAAAPGRCAGAGIAHLQLANQEPRGPQTPFPSCQACLGSKRNLRIRRNDAAAWTYM